MDAQTPHIDVRAVHIDDAPALHELDYSFETDRVYTLRMHDRLLEYDSSSQPLDGAALTFELTVTYVDIPFYRDFREDGQTLENVQRRLGTSEGGYVALADGNVTGGILLNLDEARALARIDDLIVGRQYRRYGVGSLLLSCAADWARKRGCRAIVIETQSSNYPAIQFYLRNGLHVWSINQYFYPPGPLEHEIAIIMGKKLWSAP